MSSSGGIVLQPPPKTHNHHNNKSNHMKNNTNNNAQSKRKSKHDRSGRKRSKSFSGCGLSKMMSQKPVPPTKFLLGGNITDPLNLNSLQNEEINRAMNAITPKSSPIPTPPRRKGQIEVIIPPNIHDPLNLIDCADDAEYEQQLYSPVKKGRKKRLKKRRTVSACLESLDSSSTLDVSDVVPEAKTPENCTDSAKIPDELIHGTSCTSTNTSTVNISTSSSTTAAAAAAAAPATATTTCVKDLSLELSPKKDKNKRKQNKEGEDNNGPLAKKFKHSMDKIVSPVVPQPGAWLKRNSLINKQKPRRKNPEPNEILPTFKEKDKQFQYGNYNRYYGYRNPNNEVDHRLRVFMHHRYLFEDKDILDIGCNIGHITLSVARDFGAKSVTGIDIDPKLIAIARKNVKHYVKNSTSPKNGDDVVAIQGVEKKEKSSEFFPISMPILYGPIDIPGFNDNSRGRDFPNNVIFKKCNYVLEDDALLALEQPQFDVILCLSITKWIHLNWGDAGLKQAFRRMYAQLRPGGKLILEPQNWASYKSKRKLTETIFKNYNSIEFFPDKFTEYLLSSVVGFAKSEILGYPHHHSKGFQRPIQIFTKSTMFLSERVEATPNNSSIYDDQLYQRIMKTEKYGSEAQRQPNTAAESEHIYCTNILDRYCGGSAEENDEVNKLIENDLKRAEESSTTPPLTLSTSNNNLNSCDKSNGLENNDSISVSKDNT